MPQVQPPVAAPIYSAGDMLVEAMEDGSFQVSRVSANGSIHVLGFQKTQPAALGMADRATSGYQRVFLRAERDSPEFRLVEST